MAADWLLTVRSPVQTLPPREYGGTLVVFPNLDGRIHQSPVFILEHGKYKSNFQDITRNQFLLRLAGWL
jgi:hypothetical protein